MRVGNYGSVRDEGPSMRDEGPSMRDVGPSMRDVGPGSRPARSPGPPQVLLRIPLTALQSESYALYHFQPSPVTAGM